MRYFAYAVLYDPTGRFLIGWKNELSFFYAQAGGGGVIYPQGNPVINGPHDYALPGGGRDQGETIETAARREFLEETGTAIPGGVPFAQMTVRYSDRHTFSGGYFRVDATTFNAIAAAVLNTNLPAGVAAANDILQGQITAYGQIHSAYPTAPADNELSTGYVLSVVDDWEFIQSWQGDPVKGWFYTILQYLKNNVL